jgi:hypothetical protein
MSGTRAFDLGDILTITTGRLCAIRGMDAVYDILNFLTGDSLFTHQIPRACRECGPWLLRQHPQLAAVTQDELGPENYAANLAKWKGRFGETLSVTPIPRDDHTWKDPLVELREMVGGKPIIVSGGGPQTGGETQ